MTDPEPTQRPWLRRLTALALAALAAAFAWRQIESQDIGYHLAYGERWRNELAPVDDGVFVYPVLDPRDPPAEPGPGCWYDAKGHYRFPNANWLSQAITYAAFAVGGDDALTLLVAALLIGTVLVQFEGLRRGGLSTARAGGAVLLLLLVLSWRIEPRPELFGYLVLSAQVSVLLAGAGRGLELGRREFALLVALQVLMVNLHSYFLLGLAASGCFWLHSLLVPASQPPGGRRRLGLLVAAQAVACCVNPWTWRLAILPLQTVLWLREHGVTDPARVPPHPWSAIDEFRPLPLPWQGAAWDLPLVLFYLLLAGAVVAGVAALRRRRFGHAALLVVAVATALSMRRNVPPAALLLVPTIATVLRPRLARVAPFAAPAFAVALLAVVLSGAFYRWTGSRAQVGSGFSPLYLPVGVAHWLDEHQPQGRLWTDFDASSNLHFLCAARPDVPLLTNTWAYPPAVMQFVLDRLAGAPFAEAKRLGVEVAVLETDTTAAPMVQRLAQDPAWTLVHVEPRYAVFVRRDGQNRDLAASARLDEASFDLAAFHRRWSRWPELERRALVATIRTFALLGWRDARITCIDALLEAEPDDAYHQGELGAERARRGLDRLRRGDLAAGRDDLLRAERALGRSLALRPDRSSAQQNLALVRRALAAVAGR